MKTKPTRNIEVLSTPSTMAVSLIQTLIDNYRNNQLTVINQELGMADAHSIWFDLATLKKFVYDIEHEAQKVNPAITDGDLGVRFYYAAYPKEENWDIMTGQSIAQEYAEKHTLVMIPTLKMEDEEGELLNYDFNPLDPASYSQNNSNEEPVAMALNTQANSASSAEALAQNHGNLIPPSDPKVEIY